MAVQGKTVGIIGGDTYKHFRRSVPLVVPKIQTADVPCCLERKTLNGILQNVQRRYYTAFPKSEPYKNAETQTDYRESETQTEPWEPPYKIVPGNNDYIAVIFHEIRRMSKKIGILEKKENTRQKQSDTETKTLVEIS